MRFAACFFLWQGLDGVVDINNQSSQIGQMQSPKAMVLFTGIVHIQPNWEMKSFFFRPKVPNSVESLMLVFI